MLAIAGEGATGKSTLAAGLAGALGPLRCVSISSDDYLRFSRGELARMACTAAHPDCHHVDILEQHLQLLATGQPVLKPVYDHRAGGPAPPELVAPRDIVIVHGLLPLHNRLARACFDMAVYLDAPTDRRAHPDPQRFIRPQRDHADVVVRFGPIATRDDPPGTPLSAELTLRPTIRQPDLTEILRPEVTRTMHLRLARDSDGTPVDSLHIHGYTGPEHNAAAEQSMWRALGDPRTEIPASLGCIGPGVRSTPLAITQMILLHYLTAGAR